MKTVSGIEVVLPYRILGYDRHGQVETLMQTNDLPEAVKKMPDYLDPGIYEAVDLVQVLSHSE